MKFLSPLDESSPLTPYRHIAELVVLILMSAVGYHILKRMFRTYKGDFLRSGFSGVDMNKPNKPTLPEAQGVLVGAVFIAVMFLFIPVPFWRFLFSKDYFFPLSQVDTNVQSTLQRELLFKSQFIHYLAGLLCICCMVFLGFADDALDLPWRHKCILPSVASLPLLMVYLANEGTTQIVVPVFLRGVFGNIVDIGFLYYIYMGLLTVFCTNAINIYAGINGLEVGQSLIIALSVVIFNLIELRGSLWRVHLFSLYFLIPFIAVCLALYKVNRYPASVFVGDTFCYFAGVTFAVVGVLGHFSKTLMLFFLPQMFNFVYSIPQLFALVPCPRHRLPQFNATDGLLYPSEVRFHPKSLSTFGQFLLTAFTKLGLVGCRVAHPFQPSKSGAAPPKSKADGETEVTGSNAPVTSEQELEEEIIEVTNFTLINFVLRIMGPLSEPSTTKYLLCLQILSSCLAFVIRYPLAWIFYDVQNS